MQLAIRIIATEGTAEAIQKAGIPVEIVDKIGSKGTTITRCDSKRAKHKLLSIH